MLHLSTKISLLSSIAITKRNVAPITTRAAAVKARSSSILLSWILLQMNLVVMVMGAYRSTSLDILRARRQTQPRRASKSSLLFVQDDISSALSSSSSSSSRRRRIYSSSLSSTSSSSSLFLLQPNIVGDKGDEHQREGMTPMKAKKDTSRDSSITTNRNLSTPIGNQTRLDRLNVSTSSNSNITSTTTIHPPSPPNRNQPIADPKEQGHGDNDNESVDVVGIGGKGGLVYDVNRLKKNLLQETVRAYKHELYHLLSNQRRRRRYQRGDYYYYDDDDDDDMDFDNESNDSHHLGETAEIVDKLAALVQTSPVSTTTDSNLLDGDWVLCYHCQQYPVRILSDPRRLLVIPKRRRRNNRNNNNQDKKPYLVQSSASAMATTMMLRPWPPNRSGHRKRRQPRTLQSQDNHKGGGIGWWFFGTWQRTVTLEDVEDDRAPFVKDTLRILGEFLSIHRWYDITALSRTSFDCVLYQEEWTCLGKVLWATKYPMKRKQRSSSMTFQKRNVQVIYADVDLCIMSERSITMDHHNKNGGSKDDDNGNDRIDANTSFQVYTKNEAWLDPQQRWKRKLGLTGHLIQQRILPMDFPSHRRRLRKHNRAWNKSSSVQSFQLLGVGRRTTSESNGNPFHPNTNNNNNNNDDDEEDLAASWDGESDPFVHLSADERQEQLKLLNVKQIERARQRQRAKTQRQRVVSLLLGPFANRRNTFFKRPEDDKSL